MKPRHKISGAAIVLIKRFEGFRAKAAKLDDGRWTIGYGHTLTARDGAEVDESDAEALLLYDLIAIAHAVNEWVYAPLNQNQFDALVSFACNIGVENFRRCATLRRLNEGRMLEAALAMELWRRADFEGERIVIDALVRRRACEKTLFLRPTDAWPPAPTPILPPMLDYDSGSVMPSQTPTALTARLDGERAVVELLPRTPAPTPPERRSAPTASETAAAAVSARLEAIFPDSVPEPAADQAPFPEPPPPGEALVPPTTVAAPQPALASRSSPGPAIPAAAPGPAIAWQSSARRAPPGTRSLFVLGVVGVVLFLAAVTWGFKTPGTGAVLGWGLGGLGIACFAAAAYLLLAGSPEKDASSGD